MGTSGQAVHRGQRIARDAIRAIGSELRVARTRAGLSQRQLGRLARTSHAAVGRLERGACQTIDLRRVAVIAAVLGLDLAVRLHPMGSPVRDRAHLALLARLRPRVHTSWRWRTEHPVPLPGDLRSADLSLDGAVLIMVEGETRLTDLQALERRVRTKARDMRAVRVILLVADTRHNRAVLVAYPEFRAAYPISQRSCLAALREARDPGGDAIVLL